MNQIERLSLKLEWIPTALTKAFVDEVLSHYYTEALNEKDLVPLNLVMYECYPLMVEALSWIETGGRSTNDYWDAIDDNPQFGQSIYNDAVMSASDNSFKDIMRIMRFYHLSYVENAESYKRDQMQHYSVEVW